MSVYVCGRIVIDRLQRLPADELLKTKWMKSISKVPVSSLQDLVRRIQLAGPRDSLAGPLDWEAEEYVYKCSRQILSNYL